MTVSVSLYLISCRQFGQFDLVVHVHVNIILIKLSLFSLNIFILVRL